MAARSPRVPEYRAARFLEPRRCQRRADALSQSRLKRRAALLHAELAQGPADPALTRQSSQIDQRLQRLSREASRAGEDAAHDGGRERPKRRSHSRPRATLFFLPSLPGRIVALFWEVPLIHIAVTPLPLTILDTVLVFFIIRRYVLFAGRPASATDADDALQFQAEKTIQRSALGVVLLIFLAPNLGNLYPFPSWVAHYAHESFVAYSPAQLTTLLLLIALVASGGRPSSSNSAGIQTGKVRQRRGSLNAHADRPSYRASTEGRVLVASSSTDSMAGG